jgi:hypothetical protein
MAWSDDWKARREQPCYVLCRAGAGGWCWVAWTKMPRSDYDPDGSEPPYLTPDFAGMAPTEEAALVAARSAVGLPAFQGPLHGLGSDERRRAQHCGRAQHATWVLRHRAVTQRLAKPSRHREAQQHRVVSHRVSYAPERDEHSGMPYMLHRVLRASPRFFWAHADCVTPGRLDTGAS